MRNTIELAREAGWPIEAGNELPDTGGMCFKTFEALVRADERVRLQPKKIKAVKNEYCYGDERYYANE
jgi:hypothetical protein